MDEAQKQQALLGAIDMLGLLEQLQSLPTQSEREIAANVRQALLEMARDRQYDQRQELLRFARFTESRIVFPGRYTSDSGIERMSLEDLIGAFMQADQTDWFAEAQQAGEAQDGGKVK